MNKLRRRQIRVALVHMAQAKDLLEKALDGERDAFDNQPDIVKMTDGEQMWEYIECLSAAVDDIGDVADTLEETIEGVAE